MPSGSKRRKAAVAKKKQDKSSNFHTSSTASLENDDPKIVEGDDDVVEDSLDEKRGGDSSVRSNVDEKTLKESAEGDDGKSVVAEDYDSGVVVDDGGVNGEDESESKNGGAVNDEIAKNGHNRSSSSSSSRSSRSSSDDEAHAVEQSELADESRVVEKNSFELENESQVVDNNSLELVDESHDTETDPLELEGDSQDTQTVPLGMEDESRFTEKEPSELENSEILNNEGESLIPEATTVSDYTPTEDALYSSVVETEPRADSVKLDETLLEKVIPLAQIYPLETSVIFDVVESGTNENDGHLTDYAKDNDQAIEDAKDEHDDTDNASNEEAHYISVTETTPIVDSIKLDGPVVEKVTPITRTNEDDQLFPSLAENENNGAFGFVTDIEAEKVEDKALLLSYKNEGGSSSANAPIIGTKDYGEYIKSIEVSESSEKQPLIDHPPEQVKRASWKNCCGLLGW